MTQPQLKSKSQAGRILVVDDDHAMCQLLYDLLRDEGYDVDVAYDGGSALEKYRLAPFDLAITDLMMPNTSVTQSGTRRVSMKLALSATSNS